jgi:hypothetical protein
MVIEIITLLVCTIYLFLVAISIQTSKSKSQVARSSDQQQVVRQELPKDSVTRTPTRSESSDGVSPQKQGSAALTPQSVIGYSPPSQDQVSRTPPRQGPVALVPPRQDLSTLVPPQSSISSDDETSDEDELPARENLTPKFIPVSKASPKTVDSILPQSSSISSGNVSSSSIREPLLITRSVPATRAAPSEMELSPKPAVLDIAGFFENFPQDIWGKNPDDRREDRIYEYINNHIIRINRTDAGVIEDMKQAMNAENNETDGLGWFIGYNLTSILRLYQAIRLSKTEPFRRQSTSDHELVRRGLHAYNEQFKFFIDLGCFKRLTIDQSPEEEEVVQNYGVFSNTTERNNEKMKIFFVRCKELNQYKSYIEKITILLGLALHNYISYDCNENDAAKYLKFKDYWSRFYAVIGHEQARPKYNQILRRYNELNGSKLQDIPEKVYTDRFNYIHSFSRNNSVKTLRDKDNYGGLYSELKKLLNIEGDPVGKGAKKKEIKTLEVLQMNRNKFPPEIWEKIYMLETIEEVYDYLNNHIIKITKTDAGLMQDIETAIQEEDKNKYGLLWFGHVAYDHGLYLIVQAIKNYKDFVGQNASIPITDYTLVKKRVDQLNKKLFFFIDIGYIKPLELKDHISYASLYQVLNINYNVEKLRAKYIQECENYTNLRHEIEMITLLLNIRLYTQNVDFNCLTASSKYYKRYRDYWNEFKIQYAFAKHFKDLIIDDIKGRLPRIPKKTEKEVNDLFANISKLVKEQKYHDAHRLVSKHIGPKIIEDARKFRSELVNHWEAIVEILKKSNKQLEGYREEGEPIHYEEGEGEEGAVRN